jgi:hypothetical protein
MDMHARRTRDSFVPLILFRVRGRIVDNPALHPQPRVRATEVNRGHGTIIGLPAQAFIDIGQAARFQIAALPIALRLPLHDAGPLTD